ncbi:S8 family serine peptidase [Flavobacterium sp. LB1P71]|uniref:S8 family serine peptidase n=1 Tax=unclassified Flavobacterium TaxID=196869 RepID=UPI003AAB48F6
MVKIYLLLFLFITSIGFSQEDAWVYFNTKPNSQSYISTPLLMLSQRALDRRTNQNIVLDFKDVPVESSYVSQVKAVAGITVKAKSKWLNAIHVRGTQAIINSLKTFPFVTKVDFADKLLNQTGKITKSTKIKKVTKSKKTKIDYAYGTSANQIQMLNGQLLHQHNYTGAGKIIAVLDAGFPGVNTAQPFQRLRDNNQILGGYNFVLRNPDFYTGASHGTSVLSSMGGYKENSLVGTAPDASYYLFITEDDTSENPVEESLWVEAAERADSLGVDIINTSLGYFEYDKSTYNHTYSEMNGTTAFISRGAEIAFSRGMIVVVSAGNSGGTADPYIAVPADAVSVIAVGAVKSSEVLASFSSIGPSSDGRIKPDVMAQGQSDVLSDEFGNIVYANGTSFSSPIMAGMIACLWQANPSKTNIEIRQLIIKSADRYTVPDNQYGYGIPDFNLAVSNGLSLNTFSDDFIIYPNPAIDFITISLPVGLDRAMVSIYSISGQKVLNKEITIESASISLKALSKGIYIYKVESNSFYKSGKIIKQ